MLCQSKIYNGKIKVYIIAAFFIAFIPILTMAMTSQNYTIQSDSVNIGGSEDGQSTNFDLDDTLGEAGTGIGSSGSYIINAGYRAMLEVTVPTFTFSLTDSSCTLGVLSFSSVSSCNYTITTSTNTLDGYVTTIVEDGEFRDGVKVISDVAGGAVDAGSEEYGIGLTGADRSFADDEPITGTSLTIASDVTGPISAQQVTVTHKASITSSTLAGSYSHTVTLISTGTF